MNFPGFGQVCASTLDHMPVRIMFIDFGTDVGFYTIHFPGWKEISVRQGIYSIEITADTGKMFYMTVPGSQFFIRQGPFHSKSIPARTFKIIFAPSLGLSCPEK